MRKCDTAGCRHKIPDQQGRGRQRRFCLECRPRKNRSGARATTLPFPEQPEVPRRGLVEAYQKRLEAADVLDTPDGEHVMLLAESMAAGGVMTASGLASLSRELRAAMAVALKDAPGEGDVLDELAERRRQKATGA